MADTAIAAPAPPAETARPPRKGSAAGVLLLAVALCCALVLSLVVGSKLLPVPTVLRASPTAPEGLVVRDLVARGRHPHQKWFRQWSHDDEDIVEAALDMTDIRDLADRPLDQLSGGQRQRAWIAMTLAQDTNLLLLDEPTTYLDLAHQVEAM